MGTGADQVHHDRQSNSLSTRDARLGAKVDVRSSGKVGLNFGYAIDSGSVDATALFRATAQLPDLVKPAEFFSIQAGSVFDRGTIATQSPKIEAYISPVLKMSGHGQRDGVRQWHWAAARRASSHAAVDQPREPAPAVDRPEQPEDPRRHHARWQAPGRSADRQPDLDARRRCHDDEAAGGGLQPEGAGGRDDRHQPAAGADGDGQRRHGDRLRYPTSRPTAQPTNAPVESSGRSDLLSATDRSGRRGGGPRH